MRKIILCSFLLLSMVVIKAQIQLGIDQIGTIKHRISGKRIGLVANHTSINTEGEHTLDILLSQGANVIKVFAPEHGFRGLGDAGQHVKDGRDLKSGLPIISLYGAYRRPSAEMLADVDILVYDIQDVGARFYTYISTLLYTLEAAVENKKEYIVLDRPNPCDFVDGPVLNTKYRSFVGALPIPILYGLTPGELAKMIVGERWLRNNLTPVKLYIVCLKGWSHMQPYSLPIKPSPNLPNDRSIRLYSSLCLFEGTTISVGRGTLFPFQQIGAPDPNYGSFTFSPKSLAGYDSNPLHKGKVCYGIDLQQAELPNGFSLKYLHSMYHLSPDKSRFFLTNNMFEKLEGTGLLRQQIIDGQDESTIRQGWESDLSAFRSKRTKYLLYSSPL